MSLFILVSFASSMKATEEKKTHTTVTLIQKYCIIRKHNMVLYHIKTLPLVLDQRGQLSSLSEWVGQISSCQVGAAKSKYACQGSSEAHGEKGAGDLFNRFETKGALCVQLLIQFALRISRFQQSRYSGRLSRSKRTRKLCSGTLYRKPSSAPPRCGIVLCKICIACQTKHWNSTEFWRKQVIV